MHLVDRVVGSVDVHVEPEAVEVLVDRRIQPVSVQELAVLQRLTSVSDGRRDDARLLDLEVNRAVLEEAQ